MAPIYSHIFAYLFGPFFHFSIILFFFIFLLFYFFHFLITLFLLLHSFFYFRLAMMAFHVAREAKESDFGTIYKVLG